MSKDIDLFSEASMILSLIFHMCIKTLWSCVQLFFSVLQFLGYMVVDGVGLGQNFGHEACGVVSGV